MSQTDQPRTYEVDVIPRFLVRAVGALMLATLGIVTYAQVADVPLSATAPEGNVVMSRDLLLSGELDGSAIVRNPDGTLVADLTPEQGGFISGLYRVIRRERIKHSAPMDAPVSVIWHDTGRISITDPATGWSADLMGFGADNARAVARLLAQ